MDPRRLSSVDYLSLSRKNTSWIFTPFLKQGLLLEDVDSGGEEEATAPQKVPRWRKRSASAIAYGYENISGKSRSRTKDTRFPEGTNGYLYYHLPSGAPPEAATIRFRLLQEYGDDFERAGHDLLGPDGIPWNISLPSLVIRLRYRYFRALLIEDGLLSQSTVDLFSRADSSIGREKTIVCMLGQPFVVDLTANRTYVWVSNGENFRRWYPPPLFPEEYRGVPGHVVCSLERSPLEKHAGQPYVVLRIHKFLGNVKQYTGHNSNLSDARQPQGLVEGELVRGLDGNIVACYAGSGSLSWILEREEQGYAYRGSVEDFGFQ